MPARRAQSYHIEPNTQAPARPSINYARGDAITVTMKDGAAGGGGWIGWTSGARWTASSSRRASDSAAGPAGFRPRAERGRAMSAPEWIATLGDRDPSVPIALAAITRAAGAVRPGGFRRPGDELPGGAHRLLPRSCTGRCRSRSPATRCATTSRARCCPGSPPKAGSSTRPGGDWNPVRPRVPWWGQTPEARQVVYEALLEAARRAAQRAKPRHAPGALGERAGGHGPAQELQGPAGGEPGDASGCNRARSSACWARTGRERPRRSTLLRG